MIFLLFPVFPVFSGLHSPKSPSRVVERREELRRSIRRFLGFVSSSHSRSPLALGREDSMRESPRHRRACSGRSSSDREPTQSRDRSMSRDAPQLDCSPWRRDSPRRSIVSPLEKFVQTKWFQSSQLLSSFQARLQVVPLKSLYCFSF